MPEDGENAIVEQIKKTSKWENEDYVCRSIILNDFKHTLKHKKEELTLVELGSHLCIEESLWVQDNDKPKGNNVVGPSVVNMMKHNNFIRYNDNKGKRKYQDTKIDPNKKSKLTCWKYEKLGVIIGRAVPAVRLRRDVSNLCQLLTSIEVAEKVAKGELNSAFAIVRPPGHHAEKSEPMGFCLYNNVAIAASFLLDQKKLGIKKILIVDWDVHHGNATQKMFRKDSRVLSFSVHRHENGSFYPGGDDGSHTMVGEGPGLGYNINVPWENGHCDEADYIAVWDHILIPVAKEFNPDIILISAEFDADQLLKLMEFSKGKIVMALEGGYNLDSLANSVLACLEVLLEGNPIAESYEVYPFESTWRVIKDVRGKLSKFWPILATKLPKKLTDRVKPLPEVKISAFSNSNTLSCIIDHIYYI
ncbi:histone deacetylase 5 [Tanacetum coccineum]